MEYTNEQFFRLPKWAQTEINRLRNKNDYLTTRLNQMTGEEETNTFINEMMDKKPLPKNSSIHFELPEKGYINVIINNNQLLITGQGYKNKTFYIKPRVSNSICIDFLND